MKNLINGLLLSTVVALSAAAADASGTLATLLGELKSTSAASGDSVLKSVGGELGQKVQALSQSLGGGDTQNQLEGVLQSIVGGKGVDSVALLGKLSQAKLTPSQTQLAKEVGNVGSAYLVQKNFASLEGAQGDVAQIVNSLRKGNVTAAVPSIQMVAQNAQLTPAQKDLVAGLADRYVPGTKKASEALEKGLKSIPGFSK